MFKYQFYSVFCQSSLRSIDKVSGLWRWNKQLRELHAWKSRTRKRRTEKLLESDKFSKVSHLDSSHRMNFEFSTQVDLNFFIFFSRCLAKVYVNIVEFQKSSSDEHPLQRRSSKPLKEFPHSNISSHQHFRHSTATICAHSLFNKSCFSSSSAPPSNGKIFEKSWKSLGGGSMSRSGGKCILRQHIFFSKHPNKNEK